MGSNLVPRVSRLLLAERKTRDPGWVGNGGGSGRRVGVFHISFTPDTPGFTPFLRSSHPWLRSQGI